MGAGGVEELVEAFFPIPQGGFAHPGELGDLVDGEHQVGGNPGHLHGAGLSV
jgi:hypothetical protein